MQEDPLHLSRLVDLFCTLPFEHLTAREAKQHIADLMRLAHQTNDPTAIETISNWLVALIEQMATAAGEAIEVLGIRTIQSVRLTVVEQEQLAKRFSPLLQHTEPRIRRLTMVIWAAYFRDLPEALPIIPFLQDTDIRVRSAAFEALGNIDLAKPAVLDVLLHALHSDESCVKLAVLRRIGANGRRKFESARLALLYQLLSRPGVIDCLLNALSDESPQVAIEAASILISVRDPAFRERIIEAVSTQAPENIAALSVLWGLIASPVDA